MFELKNKLLILFISSTAAFSQNFQRVDQLTGLSDIKKNNGIAVADYDLDNDLDIFIVAINKDDANDDSTQSKLFKNNNDGTFTDVTIESKITELFPITDQPSESFGLAGFKFGASWGDYNNDNYPDLFLTCAGRMILFKNNQDGTFKDVTSEAKIGNFNLNCTYASAVWFDVNKDSYLDLYISEWNNCNPSNPFFINNGDGTFTDSSEIYGEALAKSSYQAFPFDFNTDSYLDLLVSQDFQTPNSVFINKDGLTFDDNASEYNLIGEKNSDMGIAIGDYNNDGAFDFYITNIEANEFLENNGNNIYNNIADQKNVKNTGWSWDVTFSDFDLDRFEDLFVVSGFEQANTKSERNFYYKNNNGNFTDITEELSISEVAVSVGCTPFDYDNDGDLDLIVTNSDTNSYFYENKILNGENKDNLSWLKIKLEGTISNRDAIGAIVTLNTDKGTLIRYNTGVGFLSQSIKPVHFGLGDVTTINSIKIKWPNGLEETYTNNLNLNSTLKIKETEGLSVLNVMPSIKKIGCIDSTSCNYDPNAIIDDGSCQYLPPKELIGKKSTKTVKVKWELSSKSKISVTETDQNCSSLSTELIINLVYNIRENKQSIARLWNEALLSAVRNDFARPTVHARNLFHTSIALYDSWAIYDENARPYLLGNTVNGFKSEFNNFVFPDNLKESNRAKTMSYAAYRILVHRFKNAPNATVIKQNLDAVMALLNYTTTITSQNYETGNPIAMGNYIAQTIINYGLQDNSREANDYNKLKRG